MNEYLLQQILEALEKISTQLDRIEKKGTTANCRKRRSIDLRFLRYEGLTAVA